MTYRLTYARTVPATPARTFDAVLGGDLTELFDRRFLVLAPVVAVNTSPQWGRPGGFRLVEAGDGSTFTETLRVVKRPRRVRYTMTEVAGPLSLVMSRGRGTWSFDPHPQGCRVAWTWAVEPPNRLSGALEPVFRPQWSRYAGRALSRLERDLGVRRTS